MPTIAATSDSFRPSASNRLISLILERRALAVPCFFFASDRESAGNPACDSSCKQRKQFHKSLWRMRQCHSGKTPISVLHEKGKPSFLIVLSADDFRPLVGAKEKPH